MTATRRSLYGWLAFKSLFIAFLAWFILDGWTAPDELLWIILVSNAVSAAIDASNYVRAGSKPS